MDKPTYRKRPRPADAETVADFRDAAASAIWTACARSRLRAVFGLIPELSAQTVGVGEVIRRRQPGARSISGGH